MDSKDSSSEAEHLEFQAKEAQELANEHAQLLNDQIARVMISSAGSSEDDTSPSGLTSDELIFKALATVDDDGNGLDIDEIFNFIKERYEILEDFREQLEHQLGDLVSECQVERVGNHYKIPRGLFDTPRQSEVASNATQTMSSEDSTSTKPQDTPSAFSSSFVTTAPEENPQIDAAVKEVAEAEHLEFQVKEAQELAVKHTQLLNDQLARSMIDSAGSSEDDSNPSGLTSDELVFKALATVYDDGNGLDIDEIFNFIKERYEILEDFREQLEHQLGNLVSECQVERVGNRYKIPHGLIDTPRQSEVASNATQTTSSEDSTSTRPQDTPSAYSSSFVTTAPEENPQIDAAVKEVAEAEHLEFQAKEAQELTDKHTQLLNDQLARSMIDSAGSSEDDTGPSGLTSDELVFKALATVYDDGNGLDIDEIFNFIKERYQILEDFREPLEHQLGDLVSECQVERIIPTQENQFIVVHQPTGMPRMRSGRKHRKRNQNRAHRPEDPEFSDDDDDINLNDDTGLYMVLPRRSGILGKLPIHLLNLLSGKDRSAFINQSQARRCIGEERFKLVLKTSRVDKRFLLTDCLGTVHMSWATKSLSAKFFSKNSTRLLAAAGYIRDQESHPLCWDFTLCDLVSASAVVHGKMEKYEPLSHMYICQNTEKKSYKQKFVGVEKKRHSCYPCTIYDGFKFVMASGGIPKANVMEMEADFDCNVRRQDIPGEERFGITDVYRYETLEQALWRLETHPVAASLICFDGWDDPGVYIGPKEGAKYVGEHEVLMIDCIKVEGKMVIRCKSSNGEDSANGGYIHVSVEVMFIIAGGARKKKGQYACLRNPQHLLYDFYSVDMDMGSYPAQFEEDESRKELNSKFRVNFDKKDAKYDVSGRGMSCGSGIPHSSVSPYSRESASQPAKTNSAMDAYYNWAIAISDRAKMRGHTKEAEELWEQVTNNYEKAVQLNWNSSQALNNWGLALQELSKIVPAREKEKVVRTAISKFRAAIRLQFDFHLAIYNLGTVLYGLAEDTLRTRGSGNGIEMPPSELYSQSAIYIAAAHSLKPSYSVYSSALRLVRSMLPLPYLKVGYLTAPPVGNLLAPHSDWKRTEFELNHERLLQVLKPEPREMGRNLSGKSEAMNTNVEKKTVKVNITEIVSVTPCADLSLPPGAGLCIDTIHGPVFLVADSWESLDGWFDAIRLVYTIYATGKSDVLAGIITA